MSARGERILPWVVSFGGIVGTVLALSSKKHFIALAFFACAHAVLLRVALACPVALSTFVWAVVASTSAHELESGASVVFLQLVPPLAAYLHDRSVRELRAELLACVRAGRHASVACARGFASRLKDMSPKQAMDDITN